MKNVDTTLKYFDSLYPNPECALNFTTPYELLVAVILSAQCTDKRVNIVTEKLFKVANTPEKMLELGIEKLKTYIYSCGFYNNKAKSIMEMSQDLIKNYQSIVPTDLDPLTKLAGVGRKTANVVIGTAFGGQTIAVDTHVHRISKRIGFCEKNCTPYNCELSLLKIIPYEKRTKFHHQTIWFGRDICKSQNPKCDECKLKDICNYYKNNQRRNNEFR